MTMFLAFGVTFEVPVVLIVLVRFGIVSLEKLKEIRPYAIVGAFVIAAVVTPPDVVSQLLLAIPLVLLYEVGLQLARLVRKREPESDYKALGDAEMEQELDKAEAESRKNA
jgi:sec-independent protein translocase protein TatC